MWLADEHHLHSDNISTFQNSSVEPRKMSAPPITVGGLAILKRNLDAYTEAYKALSAGVKVTTPSDITHCDVKTVSIDGSVRIERYSELGKPPKKQKTAVGGATYHSAKAVPGRAVAVTFTPRAAAIWLGRGEQSPARGRRRALRAVVLTERASLSDKFRSKR